MAATRLKKCFKLSVQNGECFFIFQPHCNFRFFIVNGSIMDEFGIRRLLTPWWSRKSWYNSFSLRSKPFLSGGFLWEGKVFRFLAARRLGQAKNTSSTFCAESPTETLVTQAIKALTFTNLGNFLLLRSSNDIKQRIQKTLLTIPRGDFLSWLYPNPKNSQNLALITDDQRRNKVTLLSLTDTWKVFDIIFAWRRYQVSGLWCTQNGIYNILICNRDFDKSQSCTTFGLNQIGLYHLLRPVKGLAKMNFMSMSNALSYIFFIYWIT